MNVNIKNKIKHFGQYVKNVSVLTSSPTVCFELMVQSKAVLQNSRCVWNSRQGHSCLVMHRNCKQCFVVPPFLDPPLCSSNIKENIYEFKCKDVKASHILYFPDKMQGTGILDQVDIYLKLQKYGPWSCRRNISHSVM